jgi:hypothetical protein
MAYRFGNVDLRHSGAMRTLVAVIRILEGVDANMQPFSVILPPNKDFSHI